MKTEEEIRTKISFLEDNYPENDVITNYVISALEWVLE